MPLRHIYRFASGPALHECAYLGLRYETTIGAEPNYSEYAVFENTTEPGTDDEPVAHLRWRVKSLLTGIWRSPSKIVYVADAHEPGLLRYRDLSSGDPRDLLPLGETFPEGVFGLDDQHVYIWGSRLGSNGDHEYPVMRWDGQQWHELPMPGFRMVAMHGLAPDLLFAVGRNGFVGRFDGSRWRRFPVPTEEVLVSVFCAGPDEFYACGHLGIVLEGSKAGWGRISENYIENAPLYSVAKFRGDLWIAGGKQGVLRRVGTTDRLEVVKDNIGATWLDAREDHLLATCDDFIAGTRDGTSWWAAAENAYEEFLDGEPIMEWA
jgi:hypothetical protein